MKLKMMIAAAALVVSPAIAMAGCAAHSEQAMTCADGMTYDQETNGCVVASS